MWYVYVDWTTEFVPRPFYVGYGNDGRIETYERNQRHTYLKKKYGIVREIVMVTTVEQYAKNREIALVVRHKTNHKRCHEGHWGANMTDGGDGGYKWYDPAIRGNRVAALRASHQKPEFCERMKVVATERWSDPAQRKKHRAIANEPDRLAANRERNLLENRRCSICGEGYHYKNTCPLKEIAGPGMTGYQYTCKLCGQKGHIAKGCYRHARPT